MIFNKEFLLDSLGGDETIYKLLIEEYIKNYAEQREGIIKAINSKNFDSIHLSVHSLKGIFETYGVSEYIPLIKELITAAKAKNLEFIDQNYEKILVASQILKEDFEKELNL